MAQNTYMVKYLLGGYHDSERTIGVTASNKFDAYYAAVYNVIPEIEGEPPFAAWVESVTYKNGKTRTFNTMAGMPY